MAATRVFASLFTLLLLASVALAAPLAAQGTLKPGACRIIDPNDAIARGHAVGLRIVAPTLGINTEMIRSQSSVAGPGAAKDEDALPAGDVKVPGDGSIARVSLIRTSTDSKVTDDLESTQVSTAELVNVSLLKGAVDFRVARAHGTTFAKDGMANLDGNASLIEDLKINGVVYHITAPNTRIPLAPATFGEGSAVTVYERIDLGFFPSHEKPFYRANLTIRMLHVKIVNPPIEIVVSETNSYSQSPTAYCGGIQGVQGSAYVSRVRAQPFFWSPSVRVGYTKIPETGGWSEQTYTDISTPFDEHVLKVETATSRTSGEVPLGEISKSDAVSKLQGVCIQEEDDAPGDCFIKADLIRAESHSRAFPDPTPPRHDPNDIDTESWGHVIIANLTVNGVDVCEFIGLETTCKPPKNAPPIKIGDFTIWLNQRQRDSDPEGHTEYWVYAVKIQADNLGVVTLGRAYTGANYGAQDD